MCVGVRVCMEALRAGGFRSKWSDTTPLEVFLESVLSDGEKPQMEGCRSYHR